MTNEIVYAFLAGGMVVGFIGFIFATGYSEGRRFEREKQKFAERLCAEQKEG